MKASATGYWTFFCNPKVWPIDQKFKSKPRDGYYSITSWQADHFSPNQLGVIRVGVDRRSRQERGGTERLQPGVYAIVCIQNYPRQRTPQELESWDRSDEPPSADDSNALVVDIEYIKLLHEAPILLDDLQGKIQDKYLIEGFQASSMPLSKDDFEYICSLADCSIIQPRPDNNRIDDPEEAAFEGGARKLFVTHRAREWRFRQKKVEDHIKKNGSLRCEVPGCCFDFFKAYGELGNNYAVVHHEHPLGDREGPTKTLLSELRIVCANCHAMIHRGGASRTLAEIGRLLTRGI